MLKTNYKEEFKKLCIDYNLIYEKLNMIFDLKEKKILEFRKENVLNKINKILDEYNKGE